MGAPRRQRRPTATMTLGRQVSDSGGSEPSALRNSARSSTSSMTRAVDAMSRTIQCRSDPIGPPLQPHGRRVSGVRPAGEPGDRGEPEAHLGERADAREVDQRRGEDRAGRLPIGGEDVVGILDVDEDADAGVIRSRHSFPARCLVVSSLLSTRRPPAEAEPRRHFHEGRCDTACHGTAHMSGSGEGDVTRLGLRRRRRSPAVQSRRADHVTSAIGV